MPNLSEIEMMYMRSQIRMAQDVSRIATSLERITLLLEEEEESIEPDHFTLVGGPVSFPESYPCPNCGCMVGQRDEAAKLRCVRCGSIQRVEA